MASRDDYKVGWICALPIEVAAAKATLDRVHEYLDPQSNSEDTNNYILGSLQGHKLVVAYPNVGPGGTASIADVAIQLHASYTSIQFTLVVGIARGVSKTKEDIRLGDVVVASKLTASRSSIVQHDVDRKRPECSSIGGKALDQPTPLLLTAMGKAETAAIFGESKMPRYLSDILQKDSASFAHPDPDREVKDPMVHYGPVASSNHSMCNGFSRDQFVRKQGVLSFDKETTELKDTSQYVLIRGIGDYEDSQSSELWLAYAAAAAAAYAKEFLSFIPTLSKTVRLVTDPYVEAAPVLDALLLTRPEVDRKALVALKGRRVDGTCEWLMQHDRYREWLGDTSSSLLWISGSPGKGKTMLALYITEVLQPVVDAAGNVLLYYFCNSRDKNRNTALTVIRGILHQWIDLHPHIAKDIKEFFDGTETTKYTISNFTTLWRVFQTLLLKSTCSQVVCVLDGLDECEKESLRQLLDAVGNYLSKPGKTAGSRLKLIILSRPQHAVLERKLGQYPQIQLDACDRKISDDIKKYIYAKVDELASEQNLSQDMVTQVQQTLLTGADGTFLWVGFVTNELQDRSWSKMDEVLRHVPMDLGGIYQRHLQQVDDKQALVPILPWIVLAARPLTLEELTVAVGIEAAGGLSATQVTMQRLRPAGIFIKIEGGVVNLVQESAREFFQGDQVNVEGIDMFRMGQDTHKTLMQTCLSHVERGYKSPEMIHEMLEQDAFLSYATQYLPVHFQHAVGVHDASSELSHPFFQAESPIRNEWWKVYWEQTGNGGSPPTFTLLHFAAYFGNVPWSKLLISRRARLISRKDNYGRTPLYWAVDQGHREVVELLLDHGAHANFYDRSELTALHIAVHGQHRDVVAVLLEHGARIEAQGEHGDLDTPLMRAVLVNSRDITQELLEHGARTDTFPGLLGVASLRGSKDPIDERVKELLGLQEEVFNARFQRSTRYVHLVTKGLNICLHATLILRMMGQYLKYITNHRWDSLSVLQELVEENRREELRVWSEVYYQFYAGLVAARIPKRLKFMGDLVTYILAKAAPRDCDGLMVMTVMTGIRGRLECVRRGWEVGGYITTDAISNWVSIACDRSALEAFHFGFREFLSDFANDVRDGNRDESVCRATTLITSQYAVFDKKIPEGIDYFSRVVAEFFEGYIGSEHEFDLFSDLNQACANELFFISRHRDVIRLRHFLTSIFQFAHQAREKGQDRFFDASSVACSILCSRNATTHQWLIGEVFPGEMTTLIAQQPPGLLRTRACKTLVECLIIGKQHGLTLAAGVTKQNVEKLLGSLPSVKHMISHIFGS